MLLSFSDRPWRVKLFTERPPACQRGPGNRTAREQGRGRVLWTLSVLRSPAALISSHRSVPFSLGDVPAAPALEDPVRTDTHARPLTAWPQVAPQGLKQFSCHTPRVTSSASSLSSFPLSSTVHVFMSPLSGEPRSRVFHSVSSRTPA